MRGRVRNLLEAAAMFQRLAEDNPDTKYGEHAAFRAGLSRFQAGDIASAREIWSSFATGGDGLELLPQRRQLGLETLARLSGLIKLLL